MANWCEYEMKIKGSERAIKRVIACLKADYNYEDGKPKGKHFFRVSSVETAKEITKIGENTYETIVYGDCAWSVYSCMCEGAYAYHNEIQKKYPNAFMGTTLLEQSKDCEIEVFSEEPGFGFSEHYIFKNGECICDDTEDINYAGYNENDEITTDIDWETYDGDTIYLNPHRQNETEQYLWEI